MKEMIPYLNFDGNCREAMTFYQSCIGGDLYFMTFGEAPGSAPPEANDRIIHARLKNGTMLVMASDTMPGTEYGRGGNVCLALACENNEEVDALYAKLVDGGKGTMPPNAPFWGGRFAMFIDRYGFIWMLSYEPPRES